MTDSLSEQDLVELDAEHHADGTACAACSYDHWEPWPCDVSLLVAEVRRLRGVDASVLHRAQQVVQAQAQADAWADHDRGVVDAIYHLRVALEALAERDADEAEGHAEGQQLHAAEVDAERREQGERGAEHE
jgi:hypothetical protein